MGILVGEHTRLICQGLGKAGFFHSNKCVEYGTFFCGAIKPGHGGTKFVLGNEVEYPYFDTVEEAIQKTNANTSIIFVPAPMAKDAIMESAAAGISTIICITEGIPVLDMARVKKFLGNTKVCLIGPNCPGIITPGQAKVGIMPGYIHKSGHIGVVSRSGTLTYETVWQLTRLGLGQSTCVGIGGDPIIGTSFVDILQKFQDDPDTHAVVMIGEIGGNMEEEAAKYIQQHVTKPVIAFIAGQTAPSGKRMGHAGAIIQQGQGTAQSKMKILRNAGVHVAASPADIGHTVMKVIQGKSQ